MSVSLGWVLVQHFCEVFRLGSGNIKQACQRVGRRLRGDGFETAGYQKEVVGRPPEDGEAERFEVCLLPEATVAMG